MNETPTSAPFSLADWRVDPVLRQISRGAEVVRIDPRNLRVLQLLASRAGQVVSQSEIEKLAWNGVEVTPDSVYQSVKQLRRALGDDKAARRYIETVPRKGYRLIATVSHEPSAAASAAEDVSGSASAVPLPAVPAARGKRRLWNTSIALVAAVGIAGTLAVLVRSRDVPSATEQVAKADALRRNFQGDATFRKAITYLEGQLDTQSEAAGADDPTLVVILSRLANLYPLVSDPRQSEAAARRGLAILERNGGTRSVEGIELHATLAEALADLQQYEDAESHLRTALDFTHELHGGTHETTVATLQQFALLRIAERRFGDAEKLARRALETHRRLPEAGTARAAFLTSTIAWALIEQGRAREAIGPMDAALGAIRPGDPPAPYLVALAHHFRGEALNRTGRHAEAEAAFRSELELFATIPHVRMDEARALSALAEARLMQGAVPEAEALLVEASALLEDGEGWRETKARHETAARLQQLKERGARTSS